MGALERFARRLGLVRLERYGLALSADDRIVSLHDGAIVGWRLGDAPCPPAAAPVFAPLAALPPLAPPTRSVAPVAPLGSVAPEVAAEPPVEEDDWEWEIAMARARAAAEEIDRAAAQITSPQPVILPPTMVTWEPESWTTELATPRAQATTALATPCAQATTALATPRAQAPTALATPRAQAPTELATPRAQAATALAPPRAQAATELAPPRGQARPVPLSLPLPPPPPPSPSLAPPTRLPRAMSPATVIPVPRLPRARTDVPVRPAPLPASAHAPRRFPRGTAHVDGRGQAMAQRMPAPAMNDDTQPNVILPLPGLTSRPAARRR